MQCGQEVKQKNYWAVDRKVGPDANGHTRLELVLLSKQGIG